MSLTNFIRLLLRHWKWLILLPLVASIIVFIVISRRPKEFRSELQIYTGFGSGYSLSNTESQKFDYYAINNALDNLINTIQSDAVLEKVGLTLFAQGMIYGSQGNELYITKKSYNELLDIVPEDVKKLINNASIESTVTNLEEYMSRNNDNFVFELINLYHPHYSIWALKKIEIKKIGSSDLISISYQTDDPAICYQTLRVLSSQFIDNYKMLRTYETLDVVKYFEDQLAMSTQRLRTSEDSYMEYSKQNRVINYYEQTKAIAGQLQAFELDYDKMLAINAEAKKAMEHLEKKIGMHSKLMLESGVILAKRAEIASKTAEQTTSNIFTSDSTYTSFNVSNFDRAVAQGKAELRMMLDTMNMQRNSAAGIEVDRILDQWLDNAVQYDATTAALAVLDKRRDEIDKKFDFFAPVGATVKRKEREININEQEYLSLLHSLALAKLRQQDIAMSSSSLRVVDAPVFPISAEPSKRKLLSLAAFIAVFILTLTIILITDLTDRTLRDVARTRRLSGLDVAGVYPLSGPTQKSGFEQLATRQLIAQIMQLRSQATLPLSINILSMEPREGKSFITEIVSDQLREMGYSVLTLSHESDFNINSKKYAEVSFASELSPTTDKMYDIYLVELPDATLNIIPNGLLKNATLNLMVCRANRAWHESDSRMSKFLTANSTTPIHIVLNGTSNEGLEVFTGELPKRRSKFRKIVKRITLREFSSKDSIT